MKMIKISLVLIIALSCIESSFSQNTQADGRDPRPEFMKRIDTQRSLQAERNKRIIEQAKAVSTSARKPKAPERPKPDEAERQKALAEINNLFLAPVEYRAKYAEFLKAKNTGILRVSPDRGCDNGLVVNVKELERCGETAGIKGGGSLFSFRLNKLPNWTSMEVILYLFGQSDIRFSDGKFVVGTELIQDVIGVIGDVQLAEVTLKSDSVKFLKSFKPENSSAKVALQNQTLARGVNENGYFYSTSAPAKLDQTYVLRSIAFATHPYGSIWNTDVLTAFRVVRQEDDGSIVILWKELKESKAPFLKN